MEIFSDCESIRTEDFASKFCEYVATDKFKDSGFSCDQSDKCVTPTPKDEKYSDVSCQNPENYRLENQSRLSPSKPFLSRTLDLESIATELFDSQIQNYQDSQLLSGRSVPTDSSNTSFSLGNLENVQPIRRDILNKFLSKYSLEECEPVSGSKTLLSGDQNTKRPFPNDIAKRPNMKKEVNWKGEMNGQSNDPRRGFNSLFRSNSDLACDIRKKSIRIQNEIHEERKRKLESVQEKNITKEQTPREQLDIKVKELDQLTDRMRKARADRERISEERDSLRNKLKNKASELKSELKWKYGPKNPEENTVLRNASNSQHMYSSHDQLDHLSAQLNEKKLHLKDLEERIRQRLGEIKDLESIGLSRLEIQQVIEERNGLYEILRISEENENERYELTKQLTEAKEDLTMEHKKYREKLMKLEEELDNSFKRINAAYEEKERLSKELLHYKDVIQKQQDDTNELYAERNELRRQIDKFREDIDAEKCTSRDILDQEKKRYECHLVTEEAQAKMIINDLKHQLSTLQSENNSNVEKGLSYKSKVSQLESECQKLKNDLEIQENEFKDRLERVLEDKNQSIEKIKKEFYSKKENEIQSLKLELDSEQMRTIDSLKECYKQQIVDLQMRLESKSEECQNLKTDMRRLKQDFQAKENGLQNHYETEIIRLKEETKRNLDCLERQKSSELEDYKEKCEGLMKKMKKEIEEEHFSNERLKMSIEKANKELNQESELAKKLKADKTAAITKLKETAKEKLQEEQRNLKEYYEKELEDQLKIIEEKVQEKNSQIISKSKEIKALQTELVDMRNVFTSSMSVFFEAIHSQCLQMANEGKFNAPSFKNIKFNDETDVHEVVHLITKNFQICCQEFSQYYHERLEKFKEEKDKTIKIIEEKSSLDILAIKEQILKEHSDELNSLSQHHRLELTSFQRTHDEEIDRLRRNVKDWKQKTADRLAQKLQKEFRKEIEKKTNKRHSVSLQSFKNDVRADSMKPIGLIEDLRSNIRHLREENLSLRKVILGQNVSTLYPGDERRQSDPSGPQVGSTSRPQSTVQDNYSKNRQSSTDDSVARSCNYRLHKE